MWCAVIWYAITTPPQKERACAQLLSRKGWPSYIPMRVCRSRARKRGDVRKTIERPMVPRLLFVEMPGLLTIDVNLWWRLAQVRLVSSIIGNGDTPYPIPWQQVERMVRRNGDLDRLKAERAKAPRFAQGDVVRLTDGPLAGMTAPVQSVDGGRYRLLLEVLGAPREVEVGGDALEGV